MTTTIMKRALLGAVAVAACLATSLPALALDVAWVHSNAAAQSEQRAKAGFEAWLKETGKSDWTVSFLDSGGSGERTANNLDNAVQRGVDAVILSMADLRASEAIIAKAAADGVPVFTIDSGWVPGVIQDVTTNNWDMSAKVSVYLLDSLGGKGNIIFLRMAEHHGTRKRGETMAAILKEYPNIKVLAEHNIDYTAFYEDTVKTMEDYAARFGEEINGVWAPWDEPAAAAVSVLQKNNIKAMVTGIDGHPQAVEAVKNKDSMVVATVSQPFEGMGAQVGEWIQKVVVDKTDPATLFTTKTTYMDAPLITK